MKHADQLTKPALNGCITETLHGIEVRDPFRWLEDQEADATRSFLIEQQVHFAEYVEREPKMRSRIEREVRELLMVEEVSLPISDNRGGLLYLKRLPQEQHSSIYRRTSDGHEELLLTTAMFRPRVVRSLVLMQSSPSGRYFVVGVREGGEDALELRIFDLDTKTLLADRIPRGFPRGLMFDDAEAAFYYVHEEEKGLYSQRHAVRKHLLGDLQKADTEIFTASECPNERLILVASSDRRSVGYLCVTLGPDSHTRFLVQDLYDGSAPREIAEVRDTVFAPQIEPNCIYVHTTLGAPNGRIMRLTISNPNPSAWVEVVPERPERITGFDASEECIIVHYRHGNSFQTVSFVSLESSLRIKAYPQNGTVHLGRVSCREKNVFYLHSDFNAPWKIYRCDLSTGAEIVWWQQKIPFELNELHCERTTCPGRDGVRIPVTLLSNGRVGIPQPTILTAYAASEASLTPQFSIFVTVLVRLGFRCVLAHVRGGGELGPVWHEAGRGVHKQTSVDDFISVADWLIAEGFTSPELLGVAAQSGGSVVILAAIIQRSVLFKAAVVLGPLADMVRFHLFGVGRGFTAEFGSPESDLDFPHLLRLSPYHAVRDGLSYPALLVISGDRDRRCDSLHARKLVARLQEANSGPNPILLDYHAYRGHKPALSAEDRISALTNRILFLHTELVGSSSSQPEAL